MAQPSRKHQRITGELFRKISDYISENRGACEANSAPFAVFLNANDWNFVEPDLSVVCDPNKLNDRGCVGTPDWIIEIVSPAIRRMDYGTKLFKYRSAGVREYWIADPDKDRVMVYNFEVDTVDEYTFTDDIPAGIYPGFSVNLSKLNI